MRTVTMYNVEGGTVWHASLDRVYRGGDFGTLAGHMETAMGAAGASYARRGKTWEMKFKMPPSVEVLKTLQSRVNGSWTGSDLQFSVLLPKGYAEKATRQKAKAAAEKKPRAPARMTQAQVHALSLERFRERASRLSRNARQKELLWWLEYQGAKIPLPINAILDTLEGKVK